MLSAVVFRHSGNSFVIAFSQYVGQRNVMTKYISEIKREDSLLTTYFNIEFCDRH